MPTLHYSIQCKNLTALREDLLYASWDDVANSNAGVNISTSRFVDILQEKTKKHTNIKTITLE